MACLALPVVGAEVPLILRTGRVAGRVVRRVGHDEVLARAVHLRHRVFHRRAVAAAEHRVHHAARDAQHGVRTLHQVAAAEQVADTVVAAVAREEAPVAGRHIQRVVGRAERAVTRALAFRILRVVYIHEHRRRLGHRAAVVVAAEHRIQRAAVDVDRHSVLRGLRSARHADEGVLRTAEQRVDDDVVVVQAGRRVAAAGATQARRIHAYRDVRLLDVGYRAVAVVARLKLIHIGGGAVGRVVVELGGHHALVLAAIVALPVPVEPGGVGRQDGVVVARRVFHPAAGSGVGQGIPHLAPGNVVPRIDLAVEVVALVYQRRVHRVGNVVAAESIGVDVGRAVGIHAEVDASVGVEAAAAAIHIADVHRMVGIGLSCSQLYLGTVVALHPAGNVVAAIERIDRVAAVHRDVRAAAYIGHAAAAHHIAVDHRRMHRCGHIFVGHVVVHRDVHRLRLGGAVGVCHRHRQCGHGGLRRHCEAMQRHRRVELRRAARVHHLIRAQLQVAAARAVQRVGDPVNRQRLVHPRGRRFLSGRGGRRPVVVAAERAEAFAVELVLLVSVVIVQVDAVAIDLLAVLLVGLGHLNRQGTSVVVDVGRDVQRLAVAQRVLHRRVIRVVAQQQTLEALAGGDARNLDVVLHHRYRHEQRAVARRYVDAAQLARAVVGLVDLRCGRVGGQTFVLYVLRTVVAVARHLPLAVDRVGRMARRVEHHPVVALRTGSVAVGHIRDGGAEVPAVPFRHVVLGGRRLHLHHPQSVA